MSREYSTNDVWAECRTEILALVAGAARQGGRAFGPFGRLSRFYAHITPMAGGGFIFSWMGPQESRGRILFDEDLQSAKRAA